MHAVGSWQNTEHAKFKWGEDFIIQRQVAVVVVVVFSTSDKPIERIKASQSRIWMLRKMLVTAVF